MSFFAAVWWIAGVWASGHGSIVMYAAPVAVTVLLILAARRCMRTPDSTPADEQARQGRIVGWASGVEGVLMFVAANVLASLGMQAWTAPVLALIVGLHFFPLARWLPAVVYYLTGSALIVVAVGGLFVADESARVFVVGAGAATVLWVTAGVVLRLFMTRKHCV